MTGGSGTTGGTTTGGGGPVAQNGNVQMNLRVNASRGVPSSFTNLAITGLDANNQPVFQANSQVQATILIPNVPVNVVNLGLKYYNAAGTEVGTSTLPIALQPGATVIIDDPSYDNVTLNVTADFLSGTYLVSGADSGTVRGGLLSGQVTFDGQGRVTGGTITRRDASSPNGPATVFTVTGGTYSLAADRAVTARLTTDRYPLNLQGRGSLNTNGQSVYGELYGDNGSNDALSGFAYLQKQNVSAQVKAGKYRLSGLSVAMFGTPGTYNGELDFAGNGTVTGGTFTGPTGSAVSVSNGTWAVSASGALTGALNFTQLGVVNMTGSVGSDNYLSFSGVSSSTSDFLYFAGMPDPGQVTFPNVPGAMGLAGMRMVTGGLAGSANLSIGAGQILGGSFTEQTATSVPIRPNSGNTLPTSTFTISPNGVVTGAGEGTVGSVRLTRGLFSPDGSIFIGSLEATGVGALAGGQTFAVLAK